MHCMRWHIQLRITALNVVAEIQRCRNKRHRRYVHRINMRSERLAILYVQGIDSWVIPHNTA